jgi:hypothetical protein
MRRNISDPQANIIFPTGALGRHAPGAADTPRALPHPLPPGRMVEYAIISVTKMGLAAIIA